MTPEVEKMIVIGLVGMPGSGKSEASNFLKQQGFVVVEMGDVLREEAKKRYGTVSSETLQKLMFELRKTGGKDVVARLCAQNIKSQNNSRIIISGIRCIEEVIFFRDFFGKFSVVAIHAPPKLRFSRLKQRGREDDPQDFESFYRRDIKELEVGIGTVISLADYMIVNDGTKEELKEKVASLISILEKEDI